LLEGVKTGQVDPNQAMQVVGQQIMQSAQQAQQAENNPNAAKGPSANQRA
jgi:hypothetical protein